MADNILLLYINEDEKDNNSPKIVCNLAKQRSGMTGKFELIFNKSKNRFIGIEK